MMDLTKKGLPNVVTINGIPYLIYTDFRLWMRFENEVKILKKGQQLDVSYLFVKEMPEICDVRALLTFSRPQSPLPRQRNTSDVIVLDYELDGEYIYSAFLGQYGIDLIEIEELHWHKFLALLKGLKEDEMISRIMRYRCYEKTEENRDIYEDMRYAWEIEHMSQEEQEEIEKFSSVFE